jgi:hypothetical protein
VAIEDLAPVQSLSDAGCGWCAVLESGRTDPALYAGNDDNLIAADPVTPFPFVCRGVNVGSWVVYWGTGRCGLSGRGWKSCGGVMKSLFRRSCWL